MKKLKLLKTILIVFIFSILLYCTKSEEVLDDDFSFFQLYGNTDNLIPPSNYLEKNSQEAQNAWSTILNFKKRIEIYRDSNFVIPKNYEITNYIDGYFKEQDSTIKYSKTYLDLEQEFSFLNVLIKENIQFSKNDISEYFEIFDNCFEFICYDDDSQFIKRFAYQNKEKTTGYFQENRGSYYLKTSWEKINNATIIRFTDSFDCYNIELIFYHNSESGTYNYYDCGFQKIEQQTNWLKDGSGNWKYFDINGTVINSGEWD